jgi:hypothetical protein
MKRELWALDSETDPFVYEESPEPFVWGAKSKDDYVKFDKTEDMVKFFHDKNCLVYAHNGGKFDFHFFMHMIKKYTQIMVINGRLTKFSIGATEYRDSYAILPIPLSKYNKQKVDYKIFTKKLRIIPENKKIIEEYLKSDCVYLLDLVESFIDTNGVKLTIAGAAMSSWWKMKVCKELNQSENDYDYLKKYYYGGRVECFKKGIFNKDLTFIDITSAYPDAMSNKHHPYGAVIEITNYLPKTIGEIERSFITLECVSHGAFPIRDKSGLSFPNSDEILTFYVTGWEYLMAKKLGLISSVKIIRVVELETKINFKKYVDKWFAVKNSSVKKTPPYIIAKIMLVSLYGKFAQDSRDYLSLETVPINLVDAAIVYAMQRGRVAVPAGIIETNHNMALVGENMPWAKFHNLGTAASITGCVRAKMMESLNTVVKPYYCDTDSILCESIGELKLVDELGGWEIDAEVTQAAIAGKKMYALKLKNGETKIACKGVRLSYQEIVSVASGKTVLYKSDAPTFSIKKKTGWTKRNVKKT